VVTALFQSHMRMNVGGYRHYCDRLIVVAPCPYLLFALFAFPGSELCESAHQVPTCNARALLFFGSVYSLLASVHNACATNRITPSRSHHALSIIASGQRSCLISPCTHHYQGSKNKAPGATCMPSARHVHIESSGGGHRRWTHIRFGHGYQSAPQR